MIDTSSSLARALKETDAKTTAPEPNDMLTKMYTEAGRLIVKRTQDATPYLEANLRDRNAIASKSWSRAPRRMRKIAEIPNIVIERWLKEGFNVYQASQAELRKKLDDRDYSYVRTVPWKIGRRSRHI